MNRNIVRSAQVRFRAAITASRWRTVPSGGRFLPVRSEGERFTANLCDE